MYWCAPYVRHIDKKRLCSSCNWKSGKFSKLIQEDGVAIHALYTRGLLYPHFVSGFYQDLQLKRGIAVHAIFFINSHRAGVFNYKILMKKIICSAFVLAISLTIFAQNPYAPYKGTTGCNPVRGQQAGSACYTKDKKEGYCEPQQISTTKNSSSYTVGGQLSGSVSVPITKKINASASGSGSGTYNSGNTTTTTSSTRLRCVEPE